MLRDVKFLSFKPSDIAVAAFMLALNANLDTPLSKALDVELLDADQMNVDSYFHETTIRIRISGQQSLRGTSKHNNPDINSEPLFRWATTIEDLTKLRRDKHVRRAYKALLSSLNRKEFDGKLLDKQTVELIVPRSCSRLAEHRSQNHHVALDDEKENQE